MKAIDEIFGLLEELDFVRIISGVERFCELWAYKIAKNL